jgi:hypothetical protein
MVLLIAVLVIVSGSRLKKLFIWYVSIERWLTLDNDMPGHLYPCVGRYAGGTVVQSTLGAERNLEL